MVVFRTLLVTSKRLKSFHLPDRPRQTLATSEGLTRNNYQFSTCAESHIVIDRHPIVRWLNATSHERPLESPLWLRTHSPIIARRARRLSEPACTCGHGDAGCDVYCVVTIDLLLAVVGWRPVTSRVHVYDSLLFSHLPGEFSRLLALTFNRHALY